MEVELMAYLQAVSAADVGADAFAEGARFRRAAVDDARDELRRALALEPAMPSLRSGGEAWDTLDAREQNGVLRGLLGGGVVRRAGFRFARTPLEQGVRVVAAGTGLPLLVRKAGEASGLCELPLPDADDQGVLRMPGSEDGA